jgi:DNA-binding CsgD family transcriptional regulator
MNSVMRTVTAPTLASIGNDTGPAVRHLEAVLHTLKAGVAVIDEHGDVVSINRTLETVLGAADQLVVRRGRIAAVLASENARLQAAITDCSGSAGDRSVARDIPVWGSRGTAPLIVSVCPVGEPAGGIGVNRPVLVVAVDTAPSVGLDDRFLRDAFQLTDAEALVAKRLVGGDTLSDIAEAKGITLHTARSQLKAVMSKLGVSRQSELVAMLSKCDNVLRREQAFWPPAVGHA